jgi:hypothetical protein
MKTTPNSKSIYIDMFSIPLVMEKQLTITVILIQIIYIAITVKKPSTISSPAFNPLVRVFYPDAVHKLKYNPVKLVLNKETCIVFLFLRE